VVLIDAAVHVWSDDPATYPWSALADAVAPDHSATVDELNAEQATIGFDGAVVIQPRVYGYDHRFLTGVLRANPGRFAGVCLVHPTDPRGPGELRRLVKEHGFAGARLARLLPYGEEAADWLAGPAGDELWEEIDGLGVPVSVLARSDQLGDLVDRARRHPGTVVCVDHMALTVPAEDPAAVTNLLRCADVENVVIKVSALGHIARSPWPYEDLHPMIRAVISAFGPQRVMFGTDWPNTRKFGPYRLPLAALDRAVALDDAARSQILGETARRLWMEARSL
jgi:predicted TIM-barrel fold metal-dependent hydrolase